MVNFRRNRVEGGTYFFTVTLINRRSGCLTEQIDALRQETKAVRKAKPFEIISIVVLPDHLHAIWRLPPHDADYSGRWRSIKSNFTRNLRKRGIDVPRNERGEYRLWQTRFWEHTIRDENDLNRHIDYIHYNPVKHGLVESVYDWPYSSFHRYVRSGILPRDWGSQAVHDGKSYGEPT